MTFALSKTSRAIIAVAIAIAAFGLWQSRQPDSDDADDMVRKPSAHLTTDASQPAATPGGVPDLSSRLGRLHNRDHLDTDVNDLFLSTTPADPAPKAPLRPAKPTPPPFPYGYLGALQDGAVRTVFLSGASERVIVARATQVIDNAYRVEEVDDKQMIVTYLPLKQQQTISFSRLQ